MEVKAKKNIFVTILSYFMVVCMAFCFSACGPQQERGEQEGAKTAQEVESAIATDLSSKSNNFTMNVQIVSPNSNGENETENAVVKYDGTNFSVEFKGTTYLITSDAMYEITSIGDSKTYTQLSPVDSAISPINYIKALILGVSDTLNRYGLSDSERTKVVATENGYTYTLEIDSNQFVSDKIDEFDATMHQSLYDIVNAQLPEMLSSLIDNNIEAFAGALGIADENMARQIANGIISNATIDGLIKMLPTVLSMITVQDVANGVVGQDLMGNVVEALGQIDGYKAMANSSIYDVLNGILFPAEEEIDELDEQEQGGDEEDNRATIDKFLASVPSITNMLNIGMILYLVAGEEFVNDLFVLAQDIDTELAKLEEIDATELAEQVLGTELSNLIEQTGLDLVDVRVKLAELYEEQYADQTIRLWINMWLEMATANSDEDAYVLTIEDIIDVFVGLCNNSTMFTGMPLGQWIEEKTGVSVDDIVAIANMVLDTHVTTVFDGLSDKIFGMDALDLIDAILDEEEPLTLADIVPMLTGVTTDKIYEQTDKINEVLEEIANISVVEELSSAMGITITEIINLAFDIDFEEFMQEVAENVKVQTSSVTVKDVLLGMLDFFGVEEADLEQVEAIIDAVVEINFQEELENILSLTIPQVYEVLTQQDFAEDCNAFADTLKAVLENTTIADVADIFLQFTPVESVDEVFEFLDTVKTADLEGVVVFNLDSELKINSMSYNQSISYDLWQDVAGTNYKVNLSAQTTYNITITNVGTTQIELPDFYEAA